MLSVGSIVVLVLAGGLLVTAVLLVRSASGLPWPAIVVAALTSGVCFTVGGDSSTDASGPSIATVMGSLTGLLSVVAAVIALVPRGSHDSPAPRTPIVLSAGGIALGALGLLLTVVSS
jgi:hypothetical protein